ncbi:MAG TPA: FAD-dependent oxidoreductase, partial [Polyangiaceae bacterium]|nr:FAD-dependent oxidoreductase [Polyangiaceae bacterium]
MSEPRTVFDTVVVGAGPGGYFAAIRLAQRGQKVAVIEREDVGGVCLNWGCIPSKALISASERYAQAKNSTQMGVHVEAVRFDFAEAQAFARDVVHHHVSGVEGLLKSAGVELVRGEATVLADRRVRVLSGSTASPSERLLEASSLLIATGATPTAPPGAEPDGLTVLSAKEAVRLERLPEHLI